MSELKEKILEVDNVLILSHINPDADAIGSMLSMKYILKKLGKTAFAVCGSVLSERICGFFDVEPSLDERDIEKTGFVPDYVICVDTASPQLLGDYKDEYYSQDAEQNKIYLVIDHHYTNQLYGRYNYVDDMACAAGQIVFEIAKAFDIEINQKFAKDVYCAIICDSGSFRYASTSPKTHNIASELIATGFDFAKLNRLIYQNKSLTQIAIERLAYNTLNFYYGGKIASIIITLDLKKEAGLDGIEIEGISEISKCIAGVEVGFTMKEKDKDNNKDNEKNDDVQFNDNDNENYISEFKISLRSNEFINVAEIAADFGGGGHPRAAGCKINGNVSEVEKKLIDRIEKAFEESSEKL